MPLSFLRLLLPLFNGRSTAAAAVLLPPAPPACFYGGAALAMYQSLMRKHHALYFLANQFKACDIKIAFAR